MRLYIRRFLISEGDFLKERENILNAVITCVFLILDVQVFDSVLLKSLFLVPKPRLSSFPSPCLGTHLRPKPRLRVRLPSREAGEPPRQVRSQAGAWEREKKAGAWEREKAGAWEREKKFSLDILFI